MSDAAHPDEKDKALSRLGGEILTLQRALRAHMQKYRDPNPSLINLLGDDSADWKDYEPTSPLERDRAVIEAVQQAYREVCPDVTTDAGERMGEVGAAVMGPRIADILAGRTPEEGAKLRGEVVEPRLDPRNIGTATRTPEQADAAEREFKDPDQIAEEAFGVAANDAMRVEPIGRTPADPDEDLVDF